MTVIDRATRSEASPNASVRPSLSAPTISGPKPMPTKLRHSILIAAATARMGTGESVWMSAKVGPR